MPDRSPPRHDARNSHRTSRTTHALAALAALLAVVLGALTIAGVPVGAEPQPTVAQVAYVDGDPATPSIRWLAAPDAGHLELALSRPDVLDDPAVDLTVALGDPEGERTLTTVHRQGGTIIAANTPGGTAPPTAEVTASPDGVIELAVTPPTSTGTPAPTVVWAVLTRGSALVQRTPVFDWAELVAAPNQPGRASTWYFPDDSAVAPTRLPRGPSTSLGTAGLTIAFDGPAPTEVGGVAVTSVVDVVALHRASGTGPHANDQLWFDETAHQLSVHRGADPSPIELRPAGSTPGRPAGKDSSRPPGSIPAQHSLPIPGELTSTTILTLPLSAILEAIGGPLDGADRYSPGRRLALANGSTVVVGGVSRPIGADAAAFATGTSLVARPSTAVAPSGRRAKVTILLVACAVVAVLGLAAVAWRHELRRRLGRARLARAERRAERARRRPDHIE